jgi:SAM-dependent MidA family methyltransferase
VHQVTLRQGRLQEVYVGLEDDALVTSLGEPSTPRLAQRLAEAGVALVEGQTAEINLGLEAWALEASAALDAGFVLTIDYGHPAAELYSPQRRPRGTLVTYHRHVQTDAPLRRIGQQDITAQVDFTAVVNAGRRAGLEPLGFTTQRQFLNNLGLGRLQRRLASLNLTQRKLEANRAALVELARPGGLGDFKVLAQGKNVGQPKLWGFLEQDEAVALLEELPAPLLTPQHLSLLAGRWPQGEPEVALEELWGGGDVDSSGPGGS